MALGASLASSTRGGLRVSGHAAKRIRERLGLPKRAILRAVEKAWREGLDHLKAGGPLRAYLDGLVADDPAYKVLKVHGGAVFIFGADGTVVTCWPLPAKLSAQLRIRGEL
jgi:hypothetical protein